MKTSRLVSLFLASYLLFYGFTVATGCNKPATDSITEPGPDTTTKNKPALSGRLVFHHYSCYSCNDSKMLLYDFKSNRLETISGGWEIVNPMNAHFSPAGDKIVLMGINPLSGNWDIFLKSLDNDEPPINLTATTNAARNEDPKFSSNENEIIFKSNGVLTVMDTLGYITQTFTEIQGEASMPYFINKNATILYAAEKNSISGIYGLTSNNVIQTLFDINGIYAYYPIAFNDSSFVFTRWHSASNHHDQLYMGYLDGTPSQRLPFNEPAADYSDAYPVDNTHLLLSSTRKDAKGGYDLYIADKNTGQLWSLNEYNSGINTTLNELGASYHP